MANIDLNDIEPGSETYLNDLAGEALEAFNSIESAARTKMATSSASESPLAYAQTFTGQQAQQKLENTTRSLREGYQHLQREPAIARIIYADGSGEEHTLYISRTISLTGSGVALANQRSPIGRLASLEVGDSSVIEFPGKSEECTLIEVSLLKPSHPEGQWDSFDTVYKHETGTVKTIKSLRKLISALSADDDFESFIQGGDSEDTVIDGIAHQIRTAMELRDQPILDKFQDEIYRMPLDSQLFIAGPPGTGKTTTLIKRLGQKLDIEYLSAPERILIDKVNSDIPYKENWIMFTPTDLLKHYLKEAFNREQVPASDQHIRTWDKARHNLARNTFGLLQTGTTKGKFILKAESHYLKPDIESNPSGFFKHFSEYFQHYFFSSINSACDQLSSISAKDEDISIQWLSTLQALLADSNRKYADIFTMVEANTKDIQALLEGFNVEAEKLSTKAVNVLFKADRSIFSKIAELLNQINQEKSDIEEDEQDEDEAVITLKQITPGEAGRQLIQIFKSIGRARYLGRSVSKTSRNGRILALLGDMTPDMNLQKDIGRLSSLVSNLRIIVRSPRNYITSIGSAYKRFSRQHVEYYQTKNDTQLISATELDAIILLTLKNAHQVLDIPSISRNINESRYSFLAIISQQFKHQVLVDEATDFSTLQLASMQLLASPVTRSFFACGDFNQRLTRDGIKQLSDFDSLPIRMSIKPITTVYRQSQALNTIARQLLTLSGGDSSLVGELPKDYIHPGVQPVIVENLQQLNEISQWLAERIKEIEQSVHTLPTIGILVNDESKVAPLADDLNLSLSSLNITAEACLGGKSLGEAGSVRVFSAEYIKGLEFEAVFFVGVDELAANLPELFDKYLYVGITRAASYLGICCHQSLPVRIEPLRPAFISNWAV